MDRARRSIGRLKSLLADWKRRLLPLPPAGPLDGTLPFGVNVAGFLAAEFGLAEAARASVRSLEAVEVPVALNNMAVPHHRELDTSLSKYTNGNPYRVNLIHINPAELPQFWLERGAAYARGRYNVGFWYWEMPRFPKRWLSAFQPFHEIWVASSFCQRHIAKVSPVPVVKITCPVSFPQEDLDSRRGRFGLPESTYAFLFAFDHLSVIERKNPFALCAAFAKAFRRDEDVCLVIKCINSAKAPQQMAQLQRAARGKNIQFFDGHLSRTDSLGLLQASDCFISLHRSEGLGLGMAEAMYLGKPTIATAYGGNMDFMTSSNSFLVRYRLVELADDFGPYQRGDCWADPDVDHAAALMRQVVDDRQAARDRGLQAAADIRRMMSPEVAGREMAARLRRVAGS